MKRVLAVTLLFVGFGFAALAANLDGTWVNENPNTHGITKLVINNGGGTVRVRGKCHPRDCDWGRAGAERVGNKLVVRWHQGYADRVMTLSGYRVVPDHRYRKMRMRLVSRYHDNRGPQEELYRIRRP